MSRRLAFQAGRPILAAAFSADSRLLAVAGGAPTGDDLCGISIIDLETGQVDAALAGHPPMTRALAFAPEGRRLLSGGRDGLAVVWDPATGERLLSAAHESPVLGVAWDPAGKLYAIAAGTDSAPAELGIWDQRGRLVQALGGHEGGVYAVVFTRDGERVCSAGIDGTIRVHAVDHGRSVHVLRGHSAPCWAVDVSPRGDLIASGSHDTTVRLWDAASGAVRSVMEKHTDFVTAVRFSPDAGALVTAGNDGSVHAWRADGTYRSEVARAAKGVWAIAVSKSGDVACGSLDGSVQILRAADVW